MDIVGISRPIKDSLSLHDDEIASSFLTEEQLRTIDESIEKHQKAFDELQVALLALKARRNSLIPVSQIPPEILAHIFSFVQSSDPNPMICSTKQHLARATLTHVCRQWREIAVSDPSLWVSLPVRMHKWVAEILNRLEGSFHSVDAGSSEVSNPGFHLVLDNFHRLKELHLWDIDLGGQIFLQSYLPKSAPELESLKFISRPGSYNPKFPNTAFSETPQLRRLHIANCVFDWRTHNLLRCSLTHLQLYNVQVASPRLTGKQFVDILTKMPELQVLALDNFLPSRDEQNTSTWGSGNIHLRKLETLYIHSRVTEIEDFFRSVTFPSTVHATVIFHSEENPDHSNALFGIARSYSNAKLLFQSLCLNESCKGLRLGLHAQVWPDFDNMMDAFSVTALIDITFHFIDGDVTTFPKIMKDIFACGIQFRDIRRAYIYSIGDTTVLAETIGKLPGLDSIALTPFSAYHFLNTREGEDTNTLQNFFPKISSVCMFDITLVNASDAGESQGTKHWGFLLARRDLGQPIEKLIMRNCGGVDDIAINLLEDMVIHLDIDPITQMRSNTNEGAALSSDVQN
ncbi:hypothetical protein BDN70DRAFT_853008 [Pholiota conissans]|uniref:F-box domain-containing protein n=1 Tax=Pholiota conissans TaxID=109636 RepID=A0A9P5Z7R1_9AGAR|nr:hypothetical protein BDN70DRAFT_853008 [Pholiota conissans]